MKHRLHSTFGKNAAKSFSKELTREDPEASGDGREEELEP